MITFYSAHHFVDILSNGNGKRQTMNADQDWYLNKDTVIAEVPARDAWPLRLLPAFLRTTLKARIAARKYEKKLIAMWEISPHLLDDIGVILAPAKGMADHLVAAPARVIAHVEMHGLMQAELAAATSVPPQPVAAPTPRTAAVKDLNRGMPRTMQGSVAA